MPRSASSLVHLLPAPDPAQADTPLLRAFETTRSDEAFEELVRRHGPMVLAACRRVLGNSDDAADAFQAAFLVLARKAGTVRGNLAGWLYAVALRTARGVRIMRDRRRKHETLASARSEPVVQPETDHDLAAVIDEELAHLPEHYREAVVLCELRGLSRKQAATELGIPEGTLSSRLAAGKRKLAARLSARGLVPAALAAVLAPTPVSAGLVDSAVSAVGGTAGAVASAAASSVVKAMLFDQLKAVALAAGILLTVACGGWAMTGKSGGSDPTKPVAPAPRLAHDPATKLVEQLGAPEFTDREAAQKKLRDLGLPAEPALRAGLRSENPEVRLRSAKVLAEVRTDALAALAKGFDPAKADQPDHPVWKRYVSIAGDSRASRELFARIIANKKWLRTLDNAQADPASAGKVYRVGIAEVFRDFDQDPAQYPEWPCNRGEEVAYLLLLGSYPDNNPPAKLTGDEIVPTNLRNTLHLGRGIICGEGQITHARGLALGLEGKLLDSTKEINRPAIAGAPGTDRVFAKLLAAWLNQRAPSSEVVAPAFRIASMQRVSEILPLARRYAANDFDPKRDVPPNTTIAALELLAQLGTRADLPLFERHFGDETKVATEKETRDYNPLPPPITTQLRDVALGLAVLQHGGNPEDFGFFVRKEVFKQTAGRYQIPWYCHFHLGFENEANRTAAFTKAKAWLGEQKKKTEKPDPAKPDGQLHKFDGHTNVVAGVAFFPTGDKIVTSGFDANYRVWDAKTGKELDHRATGEKESQVGGPVVVSPDGKRIAARYFVADADTGKFLFGLEGHVAELSRIRYDREGKRLLTASYDGTIKVREADTGKVVQTIESHMGAKVPGGLHNGFGPPPGMGGKTGFVPLGPGGGSPPGPGGGPAPEAERIVGRGVRDAAFSPDGKRIVSGGVNGMVRMWDVDTGKELWGWKQSQDMLSVAFLPGGKRVVSGGAEGTIWIWDVADGKEVKKLTGHTGGVDALAVSPDGRLVSAGADKTVRVWDVEAGRELKCFRGHTAPVRAVAVSPDGKMVISGSEDNTARLWALPAVER